VCSIQQCGVYLQEVLSSENEKAGAGFSKTLVMTWVTTGVILQKVIIITFDGVKISYH
jgi:hypothetical protein